MKKLRLALSTMVAAAGIWALSGVAMAQYVVVKGPCPQPRVTKEPIDEGDAQGLAQKYADKNLKDYRAQRSSGGGGYQTVCYKDGKVFHSVEYSIDVKNKAGDMRLLRVDQFGNVTEWVGD